jgi:predicted DNA-binding transcriptional regulator AlpA
MSAPAYLTRGQLCTRWNVSRATTYRMQRDGYLKPPIRIGPGTARFPVVEIEAVEEQAAADRGGHRDHD